jgi:hypothetical protein
MYREYFSIIFNVKKCTILDKIQYLKAKSRRLPGDKRTSLFILSIDKLRKYTAGLALLTRYVISLFKT